MSDRFTTMRNEPLGFAPVLMVYAQGVLVGEITLDDGLDYRVPYDVKLRGKLDSVAEKGKVPLTYGDELVWEKITEENLKEMVEQMGYTVGGD